MRLSHRLPGSTGASADDVRRRLTDPGGDTELLVTFAELEELIDVTIANYNGTPHSALGGRSPLVLLAEFAFRRSIEVRQLFKVGREKVIAGAFVREGRIARQSIVKVIRGVEKSSRNPDNKAAMGWLCTSVRDQCDVGAGVRPGRDGQRSSACALGGSATVLRKPFDINALSDTVSRMLEAGA